MQATILGCGEAFDERYPNTSILLRARGMTVLLDCGYSVPPRIWEYVADPDEIDIVYISHPHADHYFGLPALMGRFWEDGRKKPLVVLSQPAVLEQIRSTMELGYRNLASRFLYDLDYRSAALGSNVELCGASFDFAQTQHSVTNYAVRIGVEGRAFCYSGDGMFTNESTHLFAGADLLVHEAYWFEESPVHADIDGLIGMANRQNVRRLALVHIQRRIRREPGQILTAMSRSKGAEVSLPEPGVTFEW
jgi:ribonuclease BN (tRNA processing enzyme)